MEDILNNLKTTQLLRISCSDIAGVTGFNPWSKIDELFEKYLYQDLDELMMADVDCLDTEFLTTEQEIQKILQKIDSKDKEQFDAIDAVTKDATVLNNNGKAEDMLKQIQQLMKDSGIVNKISASELKFMENEFKGRVRKNYGVHCENKSLDKYEQVMGFSVTDRNMETLKMKVMPEISTSTGKSKRSSTTSGPPSQQTADHPEVDAFAILINGSKRLSQETALVAQTGGTKKRRTHDKPSFVLIGRVDGISRQLDMSSEDASRWGENKVVVEMKSRVRGISSPPPLYEQIQLVAYMIMLECSCGDLVQAVAKKESKGVTEVQVHESSSHTVSESVVKATTNASCGVGVNDIVLNNNTVVSVTGSEGVSSSVCEESDCGATSAECSAADSALESLVSTQSSSGVDASSFLVGVESVSTTTRSATCVAFSSSGVSHHSAGYSASATITINGSIASDLKIASTVKTETNSVVRTDAPPPQYQPPSRPRRFDASVLYADEEFQVNRIQLDGPPYYHRKYWDNVVMPRLRLFRDAVAVMRSDDSVRYAYLLSGPEDKLKLLQTFCPYFDV